MIVDLLAFISGGICGMKLLFSISLFALLLKVLFNSVSVFVSMMKLSEIVIILVI